MLAVRFDVVTLSARHRGICDSSDIGADDFVALVPLLLSRQVDSSIPLTYPSWIGRFLSLSV